LPGAVYETRTHGSVRGMMLDMIIQHHPTRFLSVCYVYDGNKKLPPKRELNMFY